MDSDKSVEEVEKTEDNKKEEKEDKIELHQAHLNRLPKDEGNNLRALGWEAWRNQEGLCIFCNKLLKKSKLIFGTFEPANPEQFDGMELIPFLIHESFLKTPKAALTGASKKFMYDLFDLEVPQPKVKTLSKEEEKLVEEAVKAEE